MASVSENLELVLPTNEDVVNIGDISENFSKIDDTLGVNADEILELSTLIAALQSANQALTQRINTEILGPLNDLINDVDGHTSQLQSLTSRMTTAEGTISSNTSNITQNTNAIAQLRFDMDDAETAITEHNHDGRYILLTEKGTANGVAELDSGGKVPSSQLPSYVDDVLEYSTVSSFPATGEAGKIYVATTTNKSYRQSGSGYSEIGGGVALGETSSTAYRGDRGKVAYDHATDANRLTTATASGLYKVAATANGHIQSLTAVTKEDITNLGIPGSVTEHMDSFYATCSSAAGDQVKIATLADATGWQLRAGVVVAVKFTNTNTYSATTSDPVKLNVNNTGDKNIYYGNSATPTGKNTTAFGRANYINQYMYNGTYWLWMGSTADNDATYSSKTAASGGTDVSLCTTGEKYTWNSKADANHNHDSKYFYIKENIGTTYSDYNSYNTTGFYIDNGQGTISHRPDPDNVLPGILEVVAYGDYCHQMFKCFRSYDVYVRYLQANNTWSEWDVLSGGASYPDGNEVSY